VARRCRASRYLKPRVSGASEDFVPPAAQRRLVRRTRGGRSPTGPQLSPKQVTFLTTELQRSEVTSLGYFFTSAEVWRAPGSAISTA